MEANMAKPKPADYWREKLLKKEGHKIAQKGKKFVVVDFEKSLVNI